MTPNELLAACRVPESVAEAEVGLWQIKRWDARELPIAAQLEVASRTMHGVDRWTTLHCWTEATIHREIGECVMDDGLLELRRHLPILLAARGRVLLSGLGLGCVLRGLLAKPNVTHVDVLEIDRAIIDLIADEFHGDPRVAIYHVNAEHWRPPRGVRYDFAWHDVWSEDETLALIHARLLTRYADYCERQGAWQMPRTAKRLMPAWYLGGPRWKWRAA